MTLIDLIKVMPEEERVVIFENPRKEFAINGCIDNLMEEGTLTTEMLDKQVIDVGYCMLYSAIGIEIGW